MSEIKVVRPDILDCLANLSSDEVFTPPAVVNKMLDLLPQKLFRSPKTRFLDPFTKSGVFLREIVKRLDKELEDVIPDKEERIRHIFANQVYGIAITQLTALFSRRSLYCNKDVNNERSTIRNCFRTEGGNIGYHPCRHTWVDGSCKICGASKKALSQSPDVENYAYPFLHDEVFMKQEQELGFDVVIGNPPYQMKDGGNAASAVPIYQKFVEQAKRLNPRYLSMIIPARWYVGGRGLDDFRDAMLHDRRIRSLHDFPDASDCFPGVEIKGGVCYFLWNRDNEGLCEIHTHIDGNDEQSLRPLLESGMDTFIRTTKEISVVKKVQAGGYERFSDRMNSGRYFGFHTQVVWDGDEGSLQTADGQDSCPIRRVRDSKHGIKVYIAHGACWTEAKSVRNLRDVSKWKVLVPNAGNPGSTVLGKIRISEPGSCHSNTYNHFLANSEIEARNVKTYIETRFVRFLVGMRTTTQHTPPKVFDLVPMQDFSRPWTDAELYKKYKLTKEEISFIESMIRPMDAEEKK